MLGMVRQRAVRFVLGDYRRDHSVSTMMEDLEWETLSVRRDKLNLILFELVVFLNESLRATLRKSATRLRGMVTACNSGRFYGVFDAIMEKYDENLQDNPFFVRLLSMFPSLFEDAPHHKWVICVPRLSSISVEECSEEDFQCHIFQPLDFTNSGTAFCTLNSKIATIKGTHILLDEDEASLVCILFEECFYNSLGESFQVLCIDRPLQGEAGVLLGQETLHSFHDCLGFLRQETGSLIQIDELLKKHNQTFIYNYYWNIPKLKAVVVQLYRQVLQIVYQISAVKKRLLYDSVFKSNLHLAVETYILHNLYSPIFQELKDAHSQNDCELNMVIRNLYDLQPKDLDIKPHFCDAIPKAKKEIAKLVTSAAPLEKFKCLKRTFYCIEQCSYRPFHLQGSEMEATFTTDDLLSILCFLVLRAGIPNWYAHLAYIKNFCLCVRSDNSTGEHGFNVTTLEAAIEHIRSGALNKQKDLEFFPESLQYDDSQMLSNTSPLFPKEKYIMSAKAFFEFVRDGKVTEVEEMLKLTETDELQDEDLCHPLCLCDKCVHRQQTPVSLANSCLFLRDNKGNSALHVAVAYGHETLVDILIKSGASIEAVDSCSCTPLHIACNKGHQNIALMLLDSGANINAQDSDGNTPLHCAVNTGHINCVKTLLYCNEHEVLKLDVNSTNHSGDSSLHVAARWGYIRIVDLLLQFGANVELLNKSRQTPFDCAHNRKIIYLLKRSPKKSRVNFQERKLSRASTLSELSNGVSDETFTCTKEKSSTRALALSFSCEGKSHCQLSEQNTKVEKLLNAVVHNDIKLACYYLGISPDDLEDIKVDKPHTLCHPLCQCDTCSPIQEAASSLYRYALSSGLSINCHNSHGVTPLHEACRYGHLPMVEMLVCCGASVNVQDVEGTTPLHLAVRSKPEVVEFLLKSDALINMVDSTGNTPLHCSCTAGLMDMTSLLIKNGADANLSNFGGDTALHEAARGNRRDIVRLLLSMEATAEIYNRKRETPLDLAKDPVIIHLLKSAQTNRRLIS